jgi:hypothetical protein
MKESDFPRERREWAAVREASRLVGATVLILTASVALFCLAVEYGSTAYSFLRSAQTAGAALVAALLPNFWGALAVCTLGWAAVPWSLLIYTELAGRPPHWRAWMMLIAAGATTLLSMLSGLALFTLIGLNAGAARWIAMIATQCIGNLVVFGTWFVLIRHALEPESNPASTATVIQLRRRKPRNGS